MIETLIRVTGVSAIFFVVLILVFLLREAAPALVQVPLQNLLGTRWYPIEEYFGIVPLVLGSLWVTIGAVVLA
ncbi:MAG: phosphate ABC transporter permease subunit PstC, partial [Anaerolineae bacterium]